MRALETLGRHPSRELGLDLAEPDRRPRWLLAARLLSQREPEAQLTGAFARLEATLGSGPRALLAAGAERAVEALAAAGLRQPEPAAHGLVRLARGLEERWEGDLEALARDCDELEELGGRLARLAPGFGRAGVLRFLRPLRAHWGAARHVPLSDAAHAAGVHLGWLAPDRDPEGEADRLLRACARHWPRRDPVDAEAALERLGARACRSAHTRRCPLGAHCPALAAGRSGPGC